MNELLETFLKDIFATSQLNRLPESYGDDYSSKKGILFYVYKEALSSLMQNSMLFIIKSGNVE